MNELQCAQGASIKQKFNHDDGATMSCSHGTSLLEVTMRDVIGNPDAPAPSLKKRPPHPNAHNIESMCLQNLKNLAGLTLSRPHNIRGTK